MKDLIQLIVRDYGWIHRGLGVIGNFTFVVGSVMFLPRFEAWQVTGVWLFIAGSALMFAGAVGEFIFKHSPDDGDA